MLGFNNAAVFTTVNSTDIDAVQKYMKTELLAKLENADNTEKAHFFGCFNTDPSQFQFNEGEKRLIMEIVNHIKKTALDKGLNRFKFEPDLKSTPMTNNELCDTVIGHFFRKLPGPMDLPVFVENLNIEPEFIDISEYQRIIKKKNDGTQSNSNLVKSAITEIREFDRIR